MVIRGAHIRLEKKGGGHRPPCPPFIGAPEQGRRQLFEMGGQGSQWGPLYVVLCVWLA